MAGSGIGVSLAIFLAAHWKLLKIQLAATKATNLAGVVAKLGVAHAGVEFNENATDLELLESAIIELEELLKITQARKSGDSLFVSV